jgi:hypothetical protein
MRVLRSSWQYNIPPLTKALCLQQANTDQRTLCQHLHPFVHFQAPIGVD